MRRVALSALVFLAPFLGACATAPTDLSAIKAGASRQTVAAVSGQPVKPVANNSGGSLGAPGDLPAGLYPAVVKALQSDAPAGYEAMRRDASTPRARLAATAYRAPNPAHGFVIDFGAEGIALGPREAKAWRLGMALVGYGYGEDIRPVPPARVHVDGNRVEYRRGGGSDGSPPGLTEWYLNGQLGLEQGFSCGRDAVPLAGERRYDFPEFGGYLGNVGLEFLGGLR